MKTRTIYTLTGNPLAERTLDFAGGWIEGHTQRATRESFQVGGKGFNVAKMLHRLGAPVTALSFAGGAAGEECRAWLASHAAYPHRLFASAQPTRTGLVVRAPGRSETTFFAPDRAADATALAECARYVDTLPDDALVALCGSFPGWTEPTGAPVRDALRRRAQRGRLVADTYGAPLADLVQLPLRLVKINRGEFDALWSPTDRTRPLADRLREAVAQWPVWGWVITDGPRPAWWASSEGVGSARPPEVIEVSATGSGDVLLAGVLAAWWIEGRDLGEAVRLALPLAAANAASLGVADFPLRQESGNLQLEANKPPPARS